MIVNCFILNFNGRSIISECVLAAQAQSVSMRIIVIDNGSTDDSISKIQKHDVEIFKIKKNISFTRAYNQAYLQHGLKADYNLFISNDVFLNAVDVVERLIEEAIASNVDLIAPQSLRPDQSLDLIAKPKVGVLNLLNSYALPIRLKRFRPKDLDQNVTYSPAVIQDSCFLMKNLGQKNVFDEDFMFYFTEDDLSLSLASNGKKILYFPEVKVYHLVSYSTEKKSMSWSYNKSYKDSLTYVRKYYGKYYLLYMVLSFPMSVSRLLYYKIRELFV